MGRKVIWSPPALNALESIGDYIAKDSKRNAVTLVDDVLQLASSLVQFPERGRVVPEIHEPTLREVFVKRYRLIYEITEQTIEIIAVIHMSRNFMNAWDERNSEI